MPLEDLTGLKYLDALNRDWPLGLDLPDAGDDHIRGFKNVVLNSFPLITGAVNLTQDQINRGSVPVGSVAVFYQAAAPEGWERVADLTETRMLRVVESVEPGGVIGGSQDPVLNDQVPLHTHDVPAGSTAEGTAAHAHGGTTEAAGQHSHAPSSGTGFVSQVDSGGFLLEGGFPFRGETNPTTAQNGEHTHTFLTDSNPAEHSHTIPASETDGNPGAGNWQPRYFDVIMCVRSALT